jgi:hypothetical protein
VNGGTIRRGGVLTVFAAACMWITIPSQAQNRGVYPLGMSAINSGVMPESTFTYSNQFLLYTRDQAKDQEGQSLPVTGNHSVILDMNTITWVSRQKIIGARYGASASLPFSKNDLTSDLQGNLSGGSGFADSYYLPVILGWNWSRAAVRAMYGFLAPTGRFSAGADNNVGSGYWTHALSAGQTFYLTGNKALSISAFQLYEFHTVQEDTGVHPGQTSTWIIRSCIRWRAPGASNCKRASPVMSSGRPPRRPGPASARRYLRSGTPSTASAWQCSVFCRNGQALDSSISRNSRTVRPFRGTHFRSSRPSAFD